MITIEFIQKNSYLLKFAEIVELNAKKKTRSQNVEQCISICILQRVRPFRSHLHDKMCLNLTSE